MAEMIVDESIDHEQWPKNDGLEAKSNQIETAK